MTLRTLGVVAAVMVGMTIPSVASAYTRCATTGVNVRSGAGTSYGVVGQLGAGQRVNVYGCSYGWCQIGYGGYRAYVSGSYLGQCYGGGGYGTYSRPRTYTAPRVYHPRRYYRPTYRRPHYNSYGY